MAERLCVWLQPRRNGSTPCGVSRIKEEKKMKDNWKILLLFYYIWKPFLIEKENNNEDMMDKVLEYFEY